MRSRCNLTKDRAVLTRQVKEASDIVAVIGGFVPLKPAGMRYVGLCPFHNDHRPSFNVDPKWQNYRCWACGKTGDVFTFLQEYEKVSFIEARAMLAQRAGIALDGDQGPNQERMQQLEAIRWAAELYQNCLLELPIAERARRYLGERKLTGETIRKFGLGFAPGTWDWLVQQAGRSNQPFDVLEKVGLISPRSVDAGWYDRFRDRVMFPIKDSSGRVIGFGGRILPDAPNIDREPKYYNTPESPLFSKSDVIYGLDQARAAAAGVGYLAVVEGYTDVLMAHQFGVPQVVATMGTAMNARHIQQLRRYVQRVILVFDADAGGKGGVDRALEVFVRENVDLAIASLPAGLDPCDLLVQQGAEPFKRALESAVNALDFKLNQMLELERVNGIQGQMRVLNAVLAIVAAVPEGANAEAQQKRELVVNRIAHQLGLSERRVWERLGELRSSRREPDSRPAETSQPSTSSAPALPHEREWIELLLAEPSLVSKARVEVPVDEMQHPGLRKILDGLYSLYDAGETPDLDALRTRLDHPALASKALELQHTGRTSPADRNDWFAQLCAAFRSRREQNSREKLRGDLTTATDHDAAIELLRRLRDGQADSDSKRAG